MPFFLIDPKALGPLLGVVLGFALGEGSRLLRCWCRIRRLKRVVREELKSIRSQIPQKQDIISQMIQALNEGSLRPGLSVSMVTTGYKAHAGEVYPYLSLTARNCLHVIYQRLEIADQVLATFERDFLTAKHEGVVADPFKTYASRLGELQESYGVGRELIDSYLAGKPTDVFGVESRGQ